ncbi:unnamed protein product, partial [Mesorhabditis spiculigera]
MLFTLLRFLLARTYYHPPADSDDEDTGSAPATSGSPSRTSSSTSDLQVKPATKINTKEAKTPAPKKRVGTGLLVFDEFKALPIKLQHMLLARLTPLEWLTLITAMPKRYYIAADGAHAFPCQGIGEYLRNGVAIIRKGVDGTQQYYETCYVRQSKRNQHNEMQLLRLDRKHDRMMYIIEDKWWSNAEKKLQQLREEHNTLLFSNAHTDRFHRGQQPGPYPGQRADRFCDSSSATPESFRRGMEQCQAHSYSANMEVPAHHNSSLQLIQAIAEFERPLKRLDIAIGHSVDELHALCNVTAPEMHIRFFLVSDEERGSRSPADQLAYINAGRAVGKAWRELEMQRSWIRVVQDLSSEGRMYSKWQYHTSPSQQANVDKKRHLLCSEIRSFLDRYDQISRRELAIDMLAHTSKIRDDLELDVLELKLHWCVRAHSYIDAYRTGRIYENPTPAPWAINDPRRRT